MKVLICGDSFAADWDVHDTLAYPGWPQIVSNYHEVTNLAQAGCSEYKIWLQVSSIDISAFDRVILFHTSPYRWYVKEHPYLSNSKLHRDSDLIYNDLVNQPPFEDQLVLKIFFEKYFDLDYAAFVHGILREKIEQHIMAISKSVYTMGVQQESVDFDIAHIFNKYRGCVNHLNEKGNRMIAEKVLEFLSQ
jgi:hypothetical protein